MAIRLQCRVPVKTGSEWLVRPTIRGASHLKLFCFSYAGVGPAVFRGWSDELGSAGIEVSLVQLPGREARFRERLMHSIDEVVPPVAGAIAEMAGDHPYALYGHSLGARTAFETARELRRMGSPEPVHLVVSACQAPQLPWRHPRLSDLPVDLFLRDIQQRYGGIPEAVLRDRETLEVLLPILRADVGMLENYVFRPAPPLDCGLSVFGGQGDHTVTHASLAAWREQTTGPFHLEFVAGDHFCMPAVRRRMAHVLMPYGRRPDAHSSDRIGSEVNEPEAMNPW